MFTAKQNLWDCHAELTCVTTNGTVMKDGRLCMGGGSAGEAARYFPGIDKVLGEEVTRIGNHVIHLDFPIMSKLVGPYPLDIPNLASFPTKVEVTDQYSDLILIQQSCEELVKLVDVYDYKKIAIPAPGIGIGGLKWELVKPVLEDYLDDRFKIVFK